MSCIIYKLLLFAAIMYDVALSKSPVQYLCEILQYKFVYLVILQLLV